MSEQRLKNAFRGVAAMVVPHQDAEALRRVRMVIGEDGQADPAAIRASVPYLVIPFYLAGAQVVGNNRSMEFVVPQTYRVLKYSALVKLAPSPGSLQLRFTRNGIALQTFSILAGNTSATFPPNLHVLAAGDIVRLDVTQIGGTTNPGTDLTALITVQPDITG